MTVNQRLLAQSYITVFNAVFLSITSNDYGGAVYINNQSLFIKINYCMFIDCSTTSDCGGALYLIANKSSIYAVCGKRCMSSKKYSFMYQYCPKNSSNTANYLSFGSCTNCYYTACFDYGHIDVSYINSSQNTGLHTCGFMLFHGEDSSIAEYCSIVNCTSNSSAVLEYSDGTGMYYMKFFNILYNLGTSTGSDGIISTYRTNGTIEQTILYNNTGTYLYSANSNTILINCYLDESTQKGNTFILKDSKKVFNIIYVYATGECRAYKGGIQGADFSINYVKGNTPTAPFKCRRKTNVGCSKKYYFVYALCVIMCS